MPRLQLINVDIGDDPVELLQPLALELHAKVEGDEFFFSWVEAKARWEVLHGCRLISIVVGGALLWPFGLWGECGVL